MAFRHGFAAVGVLSLVSFLVSGCAGDPNYPGNKTTTSQHDRATAAKTTEPYTEANEPPAEPVFAIISGDVLQISVWKEDGLDRETLVLPDGTINFPLIGSLPAQGKTPYELQSDIKEHLKKFIPDAAVTVLVKAALGHTVNVIGQVTKPGEIVMGRRLTVMEALSQAGGLTPYASEGNIKILHRADGKETSIPFPYDDIIEGKKLDKDIALSPGDVVVVPTAGAL